MSSDSDLPRDIAGKMSLFTRVLMSYIDFQQAAAIGDIIARLKLHDQYPGEVRVHLQALNAAMIVAYCRPFSGNDPGSSRVYDLPSRFLKVLTDHERDIHDTVLEDRNRVIAHSDSEAWNMRPRFIMINGRRALAPIHHDVYSPLLQEPQEALRAMAVKLREAMFEERARLEEELSDYIPVID